ncbi:MAG: hypothetical protein WAN46_10070 [Gammaproteobacteria bacterium]|jgi:post-segregation antitoxin (ccd killing protein)
MKPEYDFSKGERGKFYRQNAERHLPIYLDHEVLTYLQQRAKSEGVEISQLVNDMLKHEIALAESVRPKS